MKIEPNLIPIPLEQTNWDTIIGTRIPENQATRRQVFAQASAPTQDFKEGDLWFDTDDNNTIYRANSDLSWVSVVDGSIAGKITTFAQAGIPTSIAAGDLWMDTDDNNKLYRAAAAGADQITAGEWVAVNDPTATTLIGGSVSYTVVSGGMFSFGDASDGDGLITSNTTLTTDKYYDNLTIFNSAILSPAGYRIFVKNRLLVSDDAIISRSGANGGNASGGTGGTAGAALAAGYLAGALAGANGGNTQTAGTNGSNIAANSIGVAGANGGAGGDGSANPGSGAAGGTGGTVTASNVKLIANWHLATLLDIGSTGSTVKFTSSASGGGGGGGGNASGSGGGGGASGSNGGIIAIYAKEIVVEAGCSITANGGNGGNGAAGGDGPGGGGGGGGGAGGTGGEIILVYNSLTNNGTISANGGTGGTGGAAGTGGTPQPGQNGQNGTAGHVRYFQISL